MPALTSTRQPVAGYYAPVLASYAGGSAPSSYVDLSNPPSGSDCAGVAGTTTYTDALGRAVATDDAAGTGWSNSSGCLIGAAHHTACTSYTAVPANSAGGPNASDSAPYLRTLTIDGNLHQSASYLDARGKTAYVQRFSGASATPLGSGIASYAVTSEQYDGNGNLVTITDPAGNVTSFKYDAAGRKTDLYDLDTGHWQYTYDPNGNLTESNNLSAPGYTVFVGYDGLNRPLWHSASSSGSSPWAQWTYDTGTNGIGQVTSEQFNQSSTLGKGSYTYSYDARGRRTDLTETLDGSNYHFHYTYNDADTQTSLLYTDGTTLNDIYSTTGWLSAVTLTGTVTANLATGIGYGLLGALDEPTSANVANSTFTYSRSFDDDGHLTSISLSNAATHALLYQVQPSYDSASNVAGISTAFANNVTDNQAFCYDEQNRLVWASSQTATGPNGCASNTAGNLTSGGALYTSSYTYDTLGRLTSGPLGPYTYGDSAHPHAATSIGTAGGSSPPITGRAPTGSAGQPGPGPDDGGPAPAPGGGFSAPPYSAKYDGAGNMTCRSTSTVLTASCWSTYTGGAQLSYDSEGRLVNWQNAPSGPTTTATFAYDGEGNRVVQRVTSGGGTTTTTTDYVGGGAEEVSTVSGGSGSSLSSYYTTNGLPTTVNSGGSLSTLGNDGIGSTSAALSSGNGTLVAQQLYLPYGGVRYASGTLPTARGFTGHYADAATGLDYYTARYYDPLAGQFTTPDSVLPGDGLDPWGLSRYAYVEGNPVSRTDPSGHCPFCVLAVVGAVVGAGISFGAQVVSNVQSGQSLGEAVTNVNWGDVGKAALVGAVVGFTGGAGGALLGAGLGAVGITGAVADIGAGMVIGAGEGALGQVGDNVLHGRAWSDNLGQAAVFGALTGGAGAAGGVVMRRLLAGAADDVSGNASGVWRRITARGPDLAGTKVPSEFDLDTAAGRFRVISNATKHMQEYVVAGTTRGLGKYGMPMSPFSVGVRSQVILESFANAVDSALGSGLASGDNFGVWEDWELGIGMGNRHIYHARFS